QERGRAIGAIDEVMPIANSSRKTCPHALGEQLLPAIGYQNELAFEHVDELLFLEVPVALRGPGTWSENGQVHAEPGEARGVAQLTPLAPPARLIEWAGVERIEAS